MLSGLANTIINFTDVAFVSRTGEKQLAASALGGVFYFVLVMMGMAISTGAQILIARKAGEGKPKEIGTILDHSILLLVGISGIVLLILHAFIPSLMMHIIRDNEVAQYSIDYLKARSYGLFFIMLLTAMRGFYTGIATTRIITYTTVLTMVLNIILNYILTLGNWGAPALGIIGSGYASAIAETVAALYAVTYTFFRPANKAFDLFRFKRPDRKVVLTILNLSLPIVLQHLVSMGAWFFFFIMIEKLGPRELAVSNVVRSIYMVLMTPVWGFAQAANSMVSNLIGQAKESQIFELMKKIIVLSMSCQAVVTGLCVLFPSVLFNLSTSDLTIISEGLTSFHIISAGTLIFSASMIMLSTVSGTGDTRAAMVIEMINILVYVIYVIIFTVVIPSRVEVIWGAEIFYWSLMGILNYWYLTTGRWKKRAGIISAHI